LRDEIVDRGISIMRRHPASRARRPILMDPSISMQASKAIPAFAAIDTFAR
jgi:hypothetical protein